MLVTRFDPFKQFRNLEKSLYEYPSNEGVSGFVPVVNTREGEFAYHIDVDLPGVDKKDIKVDIHKDILTISGERKTKEEIKEDDYYKIETSFGKFSRSFNLPENADVENIEASGDNGVLEVVVPKLSEEKHKKIVEIK
ncbi:MAG: heat-shock protein Hsp20 [Arcobacter sp.]|uniref:Hsp20/alpha crystallin family protein n=1 Tax=uncultured Arcobacter sp. TaxID=165434 RepID=UPI000CBA7E27|nr:Hsp20/alpha crystallin family protein [uncultured Arcobacter sp.]PLY10688.1 MAG: heat-shock protein Hsp20 [Arcobacter sp.]